MESWVERVLDVDQDFYGELRIHYRKGQVRQVERVQTFVPPGQDPAFRESVRGAVPLRAHDFTTK
jgi:hypothetical protein